MANEAIKHAQTQNMQNYQTRKSLAECLELFLFFFFATLHASFVFLFIALYVAPHFLRQAGLIISCAAVCGTVGSFSFSSSVLIHLIMSHGGRVHTPLSDQTSNH